MLSKAAKSDIVKEFNEVFKANPSVVLVEYKGLSVKELEGLRTNLKGADTRLTVVKNTLLKIAAKDTKIEQLSDQLAGPTAIAVCQSDATAAAKVFVDSAKDLPSLVIKGGIIEGNVVSLDEITAISKLPSRQEMMAQLLGALTSPMSNLLGSLTQIQTKLLYALEAVKDAKEQGNVESSEDAPVEAKEESKTEQKQESKPEVKEEAPAQVESKAEAAEETPVEAKEEKTETKEAQAEVAEVQKVKKEDSAEKKAETKTETKAESAESSGEEAQPEESETEAESSGDSEEKNKK